MCHTAPALGASPRTVLAKPVPTKNDFFGAAMATVGADMVLVGTPHAYMRTSGGISGPAILYDTNGTVVRTFSNPNSAPNDKFGATLAAFGSDRLLIGATGVSNGIGATYLFSTNGTLLTTFGRPTVSGGFGAPVAAVGVDRVLIGGSTSDASGIAYLFDTNGTLITTFTNPAPSSGEFFGSAMAGVGADLVIIGAQGDRSGPNTAGAAHGAAYLYRTNGEMVRSFFSPAPRAYEFFGSSIAVVGNDRVLIGAPSTYHEGITNGGSAYLFHTNGTLLATFTNPTFAYGDAFGFPVVAVGDDRLLIGAHRDNAGASFAGAAYLFDTNGAVLAAFTNPTPAYAEWFGYSLAALGRDQVVIGAPQDFSTVTNAGAAYLYDLPSQTPGVPVVLAQPRSQIASVTNAVSFGVSATGTGLTYQWRKDGNDIIGATARFFSLANVNRSNNGDYSVVISGPGGSATSSSATLRVIAAQQLQLPLRAAGERFQLLFRDPDGTFSSDLTRFEVHYTTNFTGAGTGWTTNIGGLTVSNGFIMFEDAVSTNLLRRFYRVIER